MNKSITIILIILISIFNRSYSQIDLDTLDFEAFSFEKVVSILDKSGLKPSVTKEGFEICELNIDGSRSLKCKDFILTKSSYEQISRLDSIGHFKRYDFSIIKRENEKPAIVIRFRKNFVVDIFMWFSSDLEDAGNLYNQFSFNDDLLLKKHVVELTKIKLINKRNQTFPPPPPPPIHIKHNASMVDYKRIGSFNQNKEFREGTDYIDSLLKFHPNNVVLCELMVYFLKKEKRIAETYPFLEIIILEGPDKSMIMNVLEDFGEAALLSGNYHELLQFNKSIYNDELNLRSRYLIRLHDFIANSLINNKLENVEYKILLEVSTVFRFGGWSFDMLQEYINASKLEQVDKEKIFTIFEELKKEKKNHSYQS